MLISCTSHTTNWGVCITHSTFVCNTHNSCVCIIQLMPILAKPKFRQLSLRIAAELKGRSMTIDKFYDLLKERLEVSYEQVRRVTKGISAPSPELLQEMAIVLELDEEELETLRVADDARKRYGKTLAAICRKNPELGPIEVVWPFLTGDQKKSIVTTAEAYVRYNTGSQN